MKKTAIIIASLLLLSACCSHQRDPEPTTNKERPVVIGSSCGDGLRMEAVGADTPEICCLRDQHTLVYSAFLRGYYARLVRQYVKNLSDKCYITWVSCAPSDTAVLHNANDYLHQHLQEAPPHGENLARMLCQAADVEAAEMPDVRIFMKKLRPGDTFVYYIVEDVEENQRNIVVAIPEEQMAEAVGRDIPENLLFGGDCYFVFTSTEDLDMMMGLQLDIERNKMLKNLCR